MSRSQTPTRWPNGLTNAAPANLVLHKYPLPFEMKDVTQWWSDFDRYRSADWTVTTVGTGTVAEIAGVGGLIRLATSAGATDAIYMDKVGEQFQFVTGAQVWFQGRFRVSDAVNTELVGGLQITDTAPMAVSDGVYFHKPSGAARLFLVQVSAATGLTTTTDTGVDVASNAFATAGYFYDANGTVFWAIKDTNGVVVGDGSAPANLPTVTLTPSLGILNAAAAIHDLDIDYVFVAQNLVR